MNPTSGVISQAWQLYKTHWKHLLAISFGIYIALGLIGMVLTAALDWLGVLLAALISIVGAFLLQGALVKAVEDIRDGTADMSLRETLERAKPHLLSMFGASILAGLGIALGLLLLIVPGLYLMTIWAVIIPVVVLENRSATEAFGRSRDLITGFGWNVFGLIVMLFLLAMAFGIVLGIVLSPLPDAANEFFSNVVSGALTAPFSALAVTLLYFRLREAKEPAAVPPPPAPAPGAPTPTI